ncbi:nuclear transport factor 2 family protein [Hoeflea sp. WL0058]|uniref:Nuclear transport factor 2 family protein n=1 Tax=Flavimaribacter sediminis TaxID=2865987 RepID=A0AAE2ZTD2_9HYPH|nr:nuclear transport factor 2 family protein [Flavimaribacter sediminis]MBW8640692.1 nuclear transport factor 2 family protein [Flavimaribacter sediminis]
MTDRSTEALVVELVDREAIRDCMYRYCRGIDRADEEALRSAYWPDAIDNHGAYNGPIEGFVQMAKKVWASGARNIHVVSNILIQFPDSDQADVESYFTAYQRGAGADGVTRQYLLVGRYCDQFEKRQDEWRVARRTVIYDWVEEQTVPKGSEQERFGPRQPVGGAKPEDPIYRLFASND